MEGLESSKRILTAKLADGGLLSGAVSAKATIGGTLNVGKRLTGKLKSGGHLWGVLSGKGRLRGKLSGMVRYIYVEGGVLAHTKVRSGTQDILVTPPQDAYGFGAVTVEGDADLVPENIKAGVEILGVAGMLEAEGGELAALTERSGTQDKTYTPPDGYYGFGTVTIVGDADLVPENIKEGVNILGVEGNYGGEEISLQEKEETPEHFPWEVTADEPNGGLSKVTLNADPKLLPENIKAGETIFGVDGSFEGGALQEVTVRSTFDRFGVEPDPGYYGIGKVIVDTDPNLAAGNIRKGVKMFDVEGTYGNFTSKSDTITRNGSYNYTPGGYDGLSKVSVTVNVPTETIENVVDANFTELYVSPGYSDQTFNKRGVTGEGEIHGYNYVKVYGDTDLISSNIRKGATIFGVSGSYEKTEVVEAAFQEKTLTPNSFPYYVRPDSGYDGLKLVILNADSDLKSSNIKSGVNIFGVTGDYTGEGAKTQAKTITPSSFPTYVYPDSSYDGLSQVRINADSNLISSNIRNGKTIFGVRGNYESPMQVGTAISGASDYKLALTEPGALGFSEVFVKGDPNLIGENIKAGISILNVEGTYEGIDLPALKKPATGQQILSGYEAYDEKGKLLTGTAFLTGGTAVFTLLAENWNGTTYTLTTSNWIVADGQTPLMDLPFTSSAVNAQRVVEAGITMPSVSTSNGTTTIIFSAVRTPPVDVDVAVFNITEVSA